MIRTKKRMTICCALTALCLAFIWGNSLLPGNVSGAISDEVEHILETLLTEVEALPEESPVPLRKAAPFTEFTALGLCLTWLFGMLRKGRLSAFLCGWAVACVDESIQIFVPDRGPSLGDVGIDTCGVLTGLLLLSIGYHCLCKRKKRHLGGT